MKIKFITLQDYATSLNREISQVIENNPLRLKCYHCIYVTYLNNKISLSTADCTKPFALRCTGGLYIKVPIILPINIIVL